MRALCHIGILGDKCFHGLVVDLKGLVRHKLDIFDNGLRWARADMLNRPAPSSQRNHRYAQA